MPDHIRLEGKTYYTDKEFCEAMQIDRRTSKRWRDRRHINYIKTPGGRIRYLQRHIEEFNKRGERKARKKR